MLCELHLRNLAVADVSRMWALIDVYEKDAREIRVGQPVTFLDEHRYRWVQYRG